MKITIEQQKAYSEVVELIQKFEKKAKETGHAGPFVFLSGILDFYAMHLMKDTKPDSLMLQTSHKIIDAMQANLSGKEYDLCELLP